MATENITDKNTLKGWFKRGLKPLEAQFHAWMDSYWHKSEKIPTSTIEGLENTLNNKAESSLVDALDESIREHVQDNTRHKTEPEQEQLDHLASNPDATYATKDELTQLENNPDVIIIPVDFTTSTYANDVKTFVGPFFEDNSIFEKPAYLKYIWKDDYLTVDALIHTCLISGKPVVGVAETLRFDSPVIVTEIEYPDEPYAYSVEIQRSQSDGGITVDFNEYKDDSITIAKICTIPSGSPEGMSATFIAPGWRELGDAVDAEINGRKYLLHFHVRDGACQAALTVSKGVVDRRKKIIEINAVIPLWKANSISEYSLHIVSEEFEYTGPLSVAPVRFTCYSHASDESKKVFVLCSDNSSNITNPEIMADFASEKGAGRNPVLYLNWKGTMLLHAGGEVVTDNNIIIYYNIQGTPTKHDPSDAVNNKMTYTTLTVVAMKPGDVWMCSLQMYDMEINIYDYMKVSNIHVAAEYPTDLSGYPDGSIFIKQSV